MKFRQAVVLVLVGWYLIAPPRHGWTVDDAGDGAIAPPVSTWIRLGTFDSEGLCQAARTELHKKVLRAYAKDKAAGRSQLIIGDGAECVASDNPVLKGN
jgi:hypothetical protein